MSYRQSGSVGQSVFLPLLALAPVDLLSVSSPFIAPLPIPDLVPVLSVPNMIPPDITMPDIIPLSFDIELMRIIFPDVFARVIQEIETECKDLASENS